jgi:hypothetical protein
MPVKDEHGNVVFITAEGRDITEKKAQEREIARQREELAQLDVLKTQFFANISHEFRTPLTLMLGPLKDVLANANGILPMDAAASLSTSHRNALRLLKLVNTMLDFSRIEAGRVQASYQPTDVNPFTSELASNFRSLCDKAGLRLIVNCAPLASSEPVYVDRDMWEKIVLNLVSNAFKFTLHGEIEVRLEEADGRVRLTVRNTGVGIPSVELPRMFERFHRIERSRGRTHEGTGIGLALVQELVEIHGGTITVASTLGEGAHSPSPFRQASLISTRIVSEGSRRWPQHPLATRHSSRKRGAGYQMRSRLTIHSRCRMAAYPSQNPPTRANCGRRSPVLFGLTTTRICAPMSAGCWLAVSMCKRSPTARRLWMPRGRIRPT